MGSDTTIENLIAGRGGEEYNYKMDKMYVCRKEIWWHFFRSMVVKFSTITRK